MERNPTPPSWTPSPTKKPETKTTRTKPTRPAEPEEPKPLGVTVAITGGSVYVRVGNGTNYRAITTVKAGMTFDHIATAHNGWNAIVINGQVGWVSGKYSRVV